MADKNSDPIDELRDEYRTIELTGDGTDADYIVYVPAGAGPAPDPVQVWDDHQDQYEVEKASEKDGTVAYRLTEVQD